MDTSLLKPFKLGQCRPETQLEIVLTGNAMRALAHWAKKEAAKKTVYYGKELRTYRR
jgi:hypothetical protein